VLSGRARRWLLDRARYEVAAELGRRGQPLPASVSATVPDPGPRPDEPELEAPARLFVSWHLRGELQGCIGTLEPWPSLAEAVARYAVIAALGDRRTPDLDPRDFGALELEISILGEPRELDVLGLDAIAPALVPGRDGVILSCRGRSAFFLPVVWKTLPDPASFLWNLCRKAGIDPAREGPHCRAQVLEAVAFGDAHDLRA
jgi:AmmeMemoRadiSam system protein A